MSLCAEFTRYERGATDRRAAEDAIRTQQMVLLREWLGRSLSQRLERKALIGASGRCQQDVHTHRRS